MTLRGGRRPPKRLLSLGASAKCTGVSNSPQLSDKRRPFNGVCVCACAHPRALKSAEFPHNTRMSLTLRLSFLPLRANSLRNASNAALNSHSATPAVANSSYVTQPYLACNKYDGRVTVWKWMETGVWANLFPTRRSYTRAIKLTQNN